MLQFNEDRLQKSLATYGWTLLSTHDHDGPLPLHAKIGCMSIEKQGKTFLVRFAPDGLPNSDSPQRRYKTWRGVLQQIAAKEMKYLLGSVQSLVTCEECGKEFEADADTYSYQESDTGACYFYCAECEPYYPEYE